MKQYAVIKSNKTGLTVILDDKIAWDTILEELRHKFGESSSFWGEAIMTLTIEGRNLSWQEQSDLVNVITENSQIEILCILDSDYKIVEESKEAFLSYYREFNNLSGTFHPGSIRGAETVESASSIVVIGDVYEDATIRSGGSIIVLGELAGTAKAGVDGSKDAVVVAYSMNTEHISIAGIELEKQSGKGGAGKPAAWILEDGVVSLKPIKKSFLNALKHKKCW